ncbi:MAG: 16S rRNA (cytosine(967)-C(5))-methyltransferase RsmB [Candidatus Geothermincolia bacterium]
MADSARDLAYQIIHRVNTQGAFLNLLIRSTLNRAELPERDAGLLTELAYGVIRNRSRLDFAIDQLSSRPLDELEPALLDLLRLGVFQLLETRISDYAAVNETVNLVTKHVNPGAARMANAILRGVANDPSAIPWPGREDMKRYLAVNYSFPEWLVGYLLENFGEEEAERLCAAYNVRAPLSLRINTLKMNLSEMQQFLEEQEISFTGSRYIPEAVADVSAPIAKLKQLLKDGRVIFQDESSMLVPYILEPQPGELIVDACAAPGGKTTHIAQLTGNEARILAVDINKERLKSLTGMAKRMGASSIKTLTGDSTKLAELVRGEPDRILLDAPCSGLGTLRRRPELKWRRSRGDIEELTGLQGSLLDGAADALRPGGTLLYSVCTITREETTGVVEAFLERRKDFRPEPAAPKCPLGCPDDAVSGDFIQLLPHRHGTDGMFMARLRKAPQ